MTSSQIPSPPAVPTADGAPDAPPVVEVDDRPLRIELGGWRDTLPGGLLRLARPKQWVKNVLVLAAPGAAGMLFEGDILLRSVGAVAAWCLVASGTYFMNDVADVQADRHHPRKRLRPVAAGIVPLALARVLAYVMLAGGVLFPLLWAPQLSLVLATYTGIQIAYSNWLKNQAVIDLAAVASGFVLRAISGGVATDLPLSNWFLLVTSFGSLFMVAGKRHAEHVDLDEDRGAHRATLEEYSLSFLRQVRSLSASVTVTAYCLWAAERMDEVDTAPIFYQLSIVPFVLALLRYALLVDSGRGGAPEEVVLSDRPLQVLGALWVLIFALGVYVN
jgi:decaprenyl-phosphate phosphoribosyltransferase